MRTARRCTDKNVLARRGFAIGSHANRASLAPTHTQASDVRQTPVVRALRL